MFLTETHKSAVVFPQANRELSSLYWLNDFLNSWRLISSSPPINPVVSNILPFLQFGYEGRVPLKSARLFYDISEKARKIVESYFMLNSTLYFSYTHMVCRTALSGEISEFELVPFNDLIVLYPKPFPFLNLAFLEALA